MANVGDIVSRKNGPGVALITDMRVSKYGTKHYTIHHYYRSGQSIYFFNKKSSYSILSQTQLRKRYEPSDLTPASLVLHYVKVSQ